MRGGFQTRRAWAIALAAYAAFMAAALSPLWLQHVAPVWDGLDFNYPGFAFAAHALREGRLPLWDPFTNCGLPFHADPQYAWYQPAAALLALLLPRAIDGYNLFWALSYAWAGLGAMLLARTLGADAAGGFVAGASFGLCGFFVGHGEHVPYFVTACQVPWTLAFAQRAVERRSVGDALLAGVAFGLSALGGYPALVVFEGIALATWLLAGLAAAPAGTRLARLRWIAATLAIAGVLLVLIWSPALHSFFAAARGYSDRVAPLPSAEALTGNPFPPRAALSLVFPRLVILADQFVSPGDVTMNDAYLGVLALPLVALCVARRREAWWVLAFASFWFAASLGAAGGVRLLLHVVPATQYLRHNSLLGVFALAALAALAGAGATVALSSPAEAVRALRTSAAWLAVAAAIGLALWLLVAPPSTGARIVLPPLLAGGALAAILAWYRADGRRAAAAVLFAAAFAGDMAAHLHGNAHTMWRQRYLIQESDTFPRGKDPAGPRSSRPDQRWTSLHQVAQAPVVEGSVGLVSDFNRVLVRSRFATVLEAHRYWLSPSAAVAPARDRGLQVLAASGTPGPVPVFVGDAADALAGQPVQPGSFGMVRLVAYEPERVELHATVPPGAGAVLASTERTAPAWSVRVDGAPARVATVNYFFRGVRLPPGEHRVVFEYRPAWFKALFALSYAIVALGLASGVLLAARRQRRTSNPAGGSAD